MNIGIVIPALNEAAIIGMAVARLAHERVVVADGGSSDGTAATARAAGAGVVFDAGGRGTQQNAGAAALGGVDALLFLHADTVLPADWRAEVEQVLDGAVLGAFRLRVPGHPVVSAGANLRSRLFGLPYGDQALFMRAATFRALGGFRPLPIMEDFDLVRRARRIGPVGIAASAAETSARRWRRHGALRTTLVNQLMLAGWAVGVSYERLAAFYRGRR